MEEGLGVGNVSSGNGKFTNSDGAKNKKNKRKSNVKVGSDKTSKKKKKSPSGEAPELVPIIDDSLFDDPEDEPGSIEIADQALEWLISPTSEEIFYRDHWEKKPLLIKRSDPAYYKTVFSTKSLEKILRENNILYGKNIDITSFDKDTRETHNTSGRVLPPVLWDFFNNGCSVRLLNPQTYHAAVWRLCSTLQDHFHSMVGANVYLTPPGTQGFAPHWDDVEVFLLQLEGKKHWKIYGPREDSEILPRFSSGNFSQSEFPKPMMEFDMCPGDFLYMPRGTVHQGNCMESDHSLHITLSTYQLNSWTDLFEKLLPAALARASQEDPEFRRGIPRDFLRVMGVAREDDETEARSGHLAKVGELLGKLVQYAPVDAAADQMGKRLMGDLLPPALEEGERARTVLGDGERWHSVKKTVVNRVEMDPDTSIRLVRASACRLVSEDDTVQLYYSTENTRQYREMGVEDHSLEVGEELAPAVEQLVTTYPGWLKVEELQCEELEQRMRLAADLWEKGIIMTSEPLESHYDDP